MSPSEISPRFPGWRVLFAAVVSLAFSPGPLIFSSLGLFAPHLRETFGWSLGQIMLSLTLFNLGGLLAAPLTGRLIDRYGARAVILPSLALFMIGFIAVAFLATTLWAFYAIAFAWGLLTVGAQSISYAKLLTAWFTARRGLAIGIAAAGLGLGYTIIPLMVNALLGHFEWRHVLAGLALVVLAGPFVIDLAFAKAPDGDTHTASPVSMDGLTLAEARGTLEFWLIAVAILLMATVLTGIVPHIVGMAREAGFSAKDAAGLAALYGASTLFGRVLVGALVDRFAVRRVAAIFFSIAGAGFAAMAFAPQMDLPPAVAAATVMVGLGFGAESDLIALFITRYFGQKAFGAIYGWLLAAFILGAAIGPALLGFGRDAFGNYSGLMLGAAGASAVAVILLNLLKAAPNAPH